MRDLKGKKVAATRGTDPWFFLLRSLQAAGLGPSDVDVALLYDHFSPMVLMQIEDYGFCEIGEGGGFVADGIAIISSRLYCMTGHWPVMK